MSPEEYVHTDKWSIDRNDNWESFRVFLRMRTVFFLFTLLALLAVAAAFWVVDVGLVKGSQGTGGFICQTSAPLEMCQVRLTGETAAAVPMDSNTPPPTADIAPAGEPQPESAASVADTEKGYIKIKPHGCPLPELSEQRRAQWLEMLVRIAIKAGNFVAIFGVVMYSLTLLGGLAVALAGRMGHTADLSRAFFLSLLAVVLIVPWQPLVALYIPGVLFNYEELLNGHPQGEDVLCLLCYYTRFVGLWAVSFLILIAAQWRSFQAAKALRRSSR